MDLSPPSNDDLCHLKCFEWFDAARQFVEPVLQIKGIVPSIDEANLKWFLLQSFAFVVKQYLKHSLVFPGDYFQSNLLFERYGSNGWQGKIHHLTKIKPIRAAKI